MMSTVSSLAASLTRAIEKEAKDLEERRELLERERERLADEKHRMASFAANGSDLVKVNVGGKVFQTHRATLLSAEGSLLETVFSGRWEESLVRDGEGNVFFDFDPAPFRALLNFLRTRSLAGAGQTVPPPQVPQEHRAQFDAMLSFMGLQDVVNPKTSVVSEGAMALRQAGSRDGAISVHGGRLEKMGDLGDNFGYRCAVGGAPLLDGGLQHKPAWKVSILQLSNWVVAGLTANPAPTDNSFQDAGTYGWATGGAMFSGGGERTGEGGWPGWQAGDVAIFQLDALRQVLRMHLQRTGQVYSLPLPADVVSSAHLYFNLCGTGEGLEVSQVSRQELVDVGLGR